MKLSKTRFFAALMILSVPWSMVLSQGPDSLLTKSGELLTGEIKSMNKGILVFETSYSETDFQIDWEEVQSISTSHKYRIYDTDGSQFLGKIARCADRMGCVEIHTANDTITRDLLDIAVILEAKEIFRDRLMLGIHLGYNYTKASQTRQFTTRSNLGYIGDRWDLLAAINAYDTRLDSIVTSRTDANLNLRISLQNNWYAFGTVDWFSSDEQQLDLRTTASTGIGNYVVRNADSYFFLFGGVTFNNEVFLREDNVESQSLEGLIAGQLELFGYSDLSLNTKLYAYPSITEKRRIRSLFSLDLKWEFISDFDLIAGFSLNFDSNPPANTEKSDYVFSLTLGWSL